MNLRIVVQILILFVYSSILTAQNCINCHQKITPKAVTDWQISKHSQNEVTCDICHGDAHNSPKNVDLVELPTYETCDRHCKTLSSR